MKSCFHSLMKNKIDTIDELKAEFYRRSCYISVIPINGILTALLALSIWLREDLELVQYCLYETPSDFTILLP